MLELACKNMRQTIAELIVTHNHIVFLQSWLTLKIAEAEWNFTLYQDQRKLL